MTLINESKREFTRRERVKNIESEEENDLNKMFFSEKKNNSQYTESI